MALLCLNVLVGTTSQQLSRPRHLISNQLGNYIWIYMNCTTHYINNSAVGISISLIVSSSKDHQWCAFYLYTSTNKGFLVYLCPGRNRAIIYTSSDSNPHRKTRKMFYVPRLSIYLWSYFMSDMVVVLITKIDIELCFQVRGRKIITMWLNDIDENPFFSPFLNCFWLFTRWYQFDVISVNLFDAQQEIIHVESHLRHAVCWCDTINYFELKTFQEIATSVPPKSDDLVCSISFDWHVRWY